MRLAVERSWDSHLCASLQGRYFPFQQHLSGWLVFFVADGVAPRDREGRKLLYLLLLPDSFNYFFKENYILIAVAAISLRDGNHHGNQGSSATS